jgi:hypothetical protein
MLFIHPRYMSANERRLGRFLREGEHGGGAAATGGAGGGTPPNQGGGGDNGGGNGGNGSQSGTGGDNGGLEFDADAFWNPPSGGEGAGPGANPGSAPALTPEQQAAHDRANPSIGTQLSQGLTALAVAPVIDAQVAEEMSNGNFENFNKRMNAAHQESGRQILGMAVSVMKVLREQMMSDMGTQVQGEFGNREDTAALHAAIPSAKNPKVAPIIKPIYAQALKITGGDRVKATEMTKQMLKLTTGTFQGDDALDIAPADTSESRLRSNTDWLEELSGR